MSGAPSAPGGREACPEPLQHRGTQGQNVLSGASRHKLREKLMACIWHLNQFGKLGGPTVCYFRCVQGYFPSGRNFIGLPDIPSVEGRGVG